MMKKKIVLSLLILIPWCYSIAQLPDIAAVEYFFNQDPGYGNAISVPINANNPVDIDFSIDVSGLGAGFHRLYVRVKDQNGKWSLAHIQSIYMVSEVHEEPEPLPGIVEAEYFFNDDPGFGNAVPIPVIIGNPVNTETNIDVSDLDAGFKRFYVRTKDDLGNWSLNHLQVIYITDEEPTQPSETPNIVEIEYFFNTDPGFGNGQSLTTTPENVIDELFTVDFSELTYGTNTLYARVKDDQGNHSMLQSKSVFIVLNADFEASHLFVEVNEPVQFTDLSGGFVFTWEWDFNNDGIVNATVKNPEWTYTEPGIYAVSLKVSDGLRFATRLKQNYIIVTDGQAIATQSIDLFSGWNLISLDVVPENNTPSSVFAEIISAGKLIYVSGYQNQQGVFFDPNGLPFLNTLQNMNPGEGYWVRLNDDATLIVHGTTISPGFQINLLSGWSLVGYWLPYTQEPANAYAPLINAGVLDIVTGFEQVGKFFDPAGPPFLNTLTEIKNGFGYWVRLNQSFLNFNYPQN